LKLTLAGAFAGGEPGAPGASGGGRLSAPVFREADRKRDLIRPTRAEIDLAALRHNAKCIRTEVGPAVKIFGVVKADAYGHGSVDVARVLAPLCDALAVSLVEEGLTLREAGITGPILVLTAPYGGSHSEVIEAGLTPVVSDPEDAERFAHAPRRRHGRDPYTPVELHLKVDTGMSRLGIPVDAFASVVERVQRLPGVRISGICTHIACAESADPAPTLAQLARFEAVLAEAKTLGVVPEFVHAGNSATMARFPQARFGAVRPGLALYGAVPAPSVKLAGLVPVMSLRTRIMAIHEIAVGTGVSYGATFVAKRPSRIATVPIGYADGYPRHVQGAEVLIRGQRFPIVGAVCMDLLMVDVTDAPGVSLGDAVTLIGRDGKNQITVDEIANWANTINYEILCGISDRVPRVYFDGPDPEVPR
jgi:alanine racemase